MGLKKLKKKSFNKKKWKKKLKASSKPKKITPKVKDAVVRKKKIINATKNYNKQIEKKTKALNTLNSITKVEETIDEKIQRIKKEKIPDKVKESKIAKEVMKKTEVINKKQKVLKEAKKLDTHINKSINKIKKEKISLANDLNIIKNDNIDEEDIDTLAEEISDTELSEELESDYEESDDFDLFNKYQLYNILEETVEETQDFFSYLLSFFQ